MWHMTVWQKFSKNYVFVMISISLMFSCFGLGFFSVQSALSHSSSYAVRILFVNFLSHHHIHRIQKDVENIPLRFWSMLTWMCHILSANLLSAANSSKKKNWVLSHPKGAVMLWWMGIPLMFCELIVFIIKSVSKLLLYYYIVQHSTGGSHWNRGKVWL